MRATVRLAFGLLLLGCGGAAPPRKPTGPTPLPVAPPVATPASAAARPPTPDAPFRAQSPEAAGADAVFAPKVVEKKLKNGIRVVAVPEAAMTTSICVVAHGVPFDVGERGDDVADLTALSFIGGTRTHAYIALRNAIVSVPMRDPVVIHRVDALTYCAVFPADKMIEGVGLVAELVGEPLFEEEVVAYKRAGYAANLETVSERDPTQAMWGVLRRALFGRHPYAAPHSTPAAIRALTRNDVVGVWTTMMAPSRISVIIAGGEEGALVETAEAAFGGIRSRPAPSRALPPPERPSGPRIVVLDRPGTTVARVAVGWVAPPAAAADAVSEEIAASILLNPTMGRAAIRIRDALGLTSLLWASTWPARVGGLSSMEMTIPTDKVKGALAAMEEERRGFVENGPTEDEMRAARAHFGAACAKSFDTPRDTTAAVASYVATGLPANAAESRARAYAAADATATVAAAKRWLQAESMRVVVSGDWASLKEPLESLGWGKVERRDVSGNAAGTDARK